LVILGVVLALKPEWGLAAAGEPPSLDVIEDEMQTMTKLLLVSMTLLFAPKVLAFVGLLACPDALERFGGARRALGGLVLEIMLSSLIAPVMMFNQVRALISILAGRDSGWPAQSREEGGLSLGEAARRHAPDTVAGLILGVASLSASTAVFLWMAPVILGLISAIPLAWITARQDLGLMARRAGLLLIPEESEPPRLIAQTNAGQPERMPEPRLELGAAWPLSGGRIEPLFG
jgi:membrane glycosyltransferase